MSFGRAIVPVQAALIHVIVGGALAVSFNGVIAPRLITALSWWKWIRW